MKLIIRKYFIVTILALISCERAAKSDFYTYPEYIKEKGLKERYDETKWLFYACLLDKKTEIKNHYGNLIIEKDTPCIALNFYSSAQIEKDSNLVIEFESMKHVIYKEKDTLTYFCNCMDIFTPERFYYCNDSLVKIECFPAYFTGKDMENIINMKLGRFSDILRKYKTQLNPWLKAEAKRRGIID